MSRISSVFADRKRKALVAYVTMGYPSMEATLEVVPVLASAGCDIIELGIPFSDPMADGTTIQEASHAALQNGVTPAACMLAAEKIGKTTDASLVFMTYYNPVLAYGLKDFCRDAAHASIDGLLVTDLPPEESDELRAAAHDQQLDMIHLLAPTSTAQRIKSVSEKADGFIYLVSVTGVTGARKELPSHLEQFVSNVRSITRKPLCVGFGISSPETAKQAAAKADGIVVGSRLVQLMGEGDKPAIDSFIRGLRQALDSLR